MKAALFDVASSPGETRVLFRQRLILALLDRAGRPVLSTALVNLAFLLRKETSVGSDQTFYSFVPYRYGPFSFALYRELASLERDGYVQGSEKSLSLNPATSHRSRDEIARLTKPQVEAVDEVVARYGCMKPATLLRNVHGRYPWYAQNSELTDFVPDDVPRPPLRRVAAYTVGYEGKSVDAFFNHLLSSGIGAILDVRANPVSRKYGFAKRSMRQIAQSLDLAYHHFPELGITGEHRAKLSDFDSYQRLLDKYERRMLPKLTAHIRQAAALLRSRPSALLCVEKDVRCCHRGRLADHLAEESDLAVVHL